MNILIVSASPDHLNTNFKLRHSLALGFRQLSKKISTTECELISATTLITFNYYDLVILFGSCAPNESYYLDIKSHCLRKDVPLAIWLHDEPYENHFIDKVVGIYDFLFINDKNTLCQMDLDNAYHLPLAADSSYYRAPARSVGDSQLFFCGHAHDNRIELIQDIISLNLDIPVAVYGSGWPEELNPSCLNIRLGSTKIADYYSSSLATLYIGRSVDISGNALNILPSTPGPRLFEAALAGALQLVHYTECEVNEFFDNGREFLTYDSPADVPLLLKEYSDANKRLSIIESAQKTALNRHTYKNRAQAIIDVIFG